MHLYLQIDMSTYGHLGKCFHFFGVDGVVQREPVEELENNHDEADTIIYLHAEIIYEVGADNIIIRAAETDIAVMLLHHSDKLEAKLWMDVGTIGKNDRWYIPLSAYCVFTGNRHLRCTAWVPCVHGVRLHIGVHEKRQSTSTSLGREGR